MSRGSSGDGTLWLCAGAAALGLVAILALLLWLGRAGLAPFWPAPVVEIGLADGRTLLGEVADRRGGTLAIRGSEREHVGGAYVRIDEDTIASRRLPSDAFAITLRAGRRLFGSGDALAADAMLRSVPGANAAAVVEWPNGHGFFGRLGLFLREAGRFLIAPTNAPSPAGGAFPALIGTVVLVFLMSLVVMPLGVATAVYLHEQRGSAAGLVRSAIANLAGVPSIVYGVLGLGLFVHGIGAGVDRWLFADRLPVPTFGSGGLLWAALTLALLTLPVVVVSVEEGLARIPPGLRAGSLALGATRGETMWRLLLPAARPALLTGLILAIARAAGAVAPLMLVGVVRLAPALPVDGAFPFLHPSRQFMHLGFSVYDAALASPDALRGVPRAYACALLLVIVVVALNLAAIVLRNRLRERYRVLEG